MSQVTRPAVAALGAVVMGPLSGLLVKAKHVYRPQNVFS